MSEVVVQIRCEAPGCRSGRPPATIANHFGKVYEDGVVECATYLLCRRCANMYKKWSQDYDFDRYEPLIRFEPDSDEAFCLYEAWCTLAAVCE